MWLNARQQVNRPRTKRHRRRRLKTVDKTEDAHFLACMCYMYAHLGVQPLAASQAVAQQHRSRPQLIRPGLGLAAGCKSSNMASVALPQPELAPSGPTDAAAAGAAASAPVLKSTAAPPVHSSSLHATGQPDTPMEVITDLLRKAQGCSTLEECQIYVQRAVDISSGLDM